MTHPMTFEDAKTWLQAASRRMSDLSQAVLLLGMLLSFALAASSQTQKLVVTPYSVLGTQTSIGNASAANVAVDSKDNVYYPNFYNNAIYKIDTQGNQTVVPSTGLNSPQGMRFDGSDNLYVCDALNSRIVVLTSAGVQTVLPMTLLNQPQHLAFDSGYQNLYVSDRYAGILQYNLASQKTTVYATNLFRAEGIAVDAQNNVYYGDGNTLVKNRVAFSTSAGEPDALLSDPAGNLYVMSSSGSGLHRIDPSGTVLALADDGSNDIAIDSHGVLYMPSHNGQHMFAYLPGPAIWGGRIDAFVGGRIDYHYANTIRTYYATPSGVTLTSVTFPAAGSPYKGLGDPSCFSSTVCGFSLSLGAFLPGRQPGFALATFSDGTRTTTPLYGSGLQVEMGFSPGKTTQINLGSNYYGGAANDLNGSVYVSDQSGNKVVKVTGTTVTPLAFTGLRLPGQLAVDGTGSVYVLDSQAVRILKLDSAGKQTVAFALSQQATTLPTLSSVQSFAVDGATNLYVAGLNAAGTPLIEMYGANGVTSVYATEPSLAMAMAFDTFGTLYAVESQGTLVKYDHFANRLPVASGLGGIFSMAIEPSGTVYLAHFLSSILTQVTPAGVATTYKVPGVSSPTVVTIDNYGNLFIGDDATQLLTVVDRTTQPYGFGNVAVKTSSTLHSSLVNVGSTDGLTISSISADAPFVVDPNTTTCVPGTTNLVAGASCELGFTFTPTNVQSYSDTGYVQIPLPTPYYSATVASLALTGNGVQASPAANAGGPYSGTAGSSVRFNGSASTDPNNEALTYAWSFGDNTSATGATPTHTYTAAGTYTVTLTVTNTDGATALATTTATIAQSSVLTATPAASVLIFAPAPVAAMPTAAQTMTASFTVTGYTGTLPTAVLHYGLSYSLGTVSCTGTGTATCTVPVTFKPLYPGGRRDAIFLMNGNTRLATMLLSGIGQGPLSLLEPGVLTAAHTDGNLYFYNSVVDENGTDYVVSGAQSVVTSVTAAGVATQLPIQVNTPRSIAIDGAGVLYIAGSAPRIISTYDTVTGVQGSMQNPDGTLYITSLALDDKGKLYENDQTNIYELSESGGAFTTTPINPDPIQTTGLIVDSNGNLFLSGDYGENELTPAGMQTQINQRRHDIYGYVIDAADSLYVGRFSNTENVGMLPASNAWTAGIGPDLAPNTSPLGLGIGGDGTLWTGNYNSLNKTDRSQGALTFDATDPGQAADPQTAYLYNGGNQPLMLTSFALSGDADYTLSTPATGVACTAGVSIPAGGLCGVVVNFTAPGHGGLYKGTLTFTTNSLNTVTNQIVTLADAVTGPYLVPSPASLNFGNVALNTTSATMNVMFTNRGFTANNSITDIRSTNPAFAAGTIPAACNSIAVDGSCTIGVTFTPAASGSASGTLTFITGNGSSAVVNVTGTGGNPQPAATLSPATLTFGTQLAGTTSAAQTLTLSNTGTVSLAITSLGLGGANASSFSVGANTCGASLAPAATCTVSVAFSPMAAGTFTASFAVVDGAGTQSTTLTGAGVAPTATLTPATYNFGAVATGLSQSSVFTLTNTSTTSIAVGTIVLAPEATNSYSYTKTCGATLAAGAACTFTVTFKPTVGGSSSTSLNISDDAGTQKAIITGNGLAPTATLTPASYDFGPLAVGSSASKDFTLTNTSTVPITITAIVPPTGFDFSRTTNCTSTLAAGASCTITVTYTPTANGQTGNSISVKDSAGTQVAGFTGQPVSPTARLRPSTYAFGNLVVGAHAQATFVLTNTSKINLTFGDAELAVDATQSYSKGTTCPTTIAPGASCTVIVTFAPTTTGPINTTLYLNDNAGQQSATITGYGGLPVLNLFPAGFNFGQVNEGTSAGETFKVTNGNPVPVTFQSVHLGANASDSFSMSNGCTGTLASGASCNITVTFLPYTPTALTTQLVLTDSAGTQTATLTGQGVAPLGYVASDGSVSTTFQTALHDQAGNAVSSFFAVPFGAHPSYTFTIRNTGAAPYPSAFTIQGPGQGAFSLSGCNILLAVGQSCVLTLTFNAPNLGDYAGTLTPPDPRVLSPLIVDGTSVQQPVLALVAPLPLNIDGDWPVGATRKLFYSATNNYKEIITGLTLTLPAPNSLDIAMSQEFAFGLSNVTRDCVYDNPFIDQGGSCTFEVDFTPTATGAAADVLSVESFTSLAFTSSSAVPSNSSGVQLLRFKGNGVLAPLASLSAASVDFGHVAIGTAASQTLTLTNSATTALNIAGLSLSGAAAGSYSVSSACGSLLAGHASCTISLKLDTSVIGTYAATLTLSSNSFASATQTVALTGTVDPAQAVLSASSLDFGNVAPGLSATQTLTLANPGTGPLGITNALIVAGPYGISANTCTATLAAGASCTYTLTFTPTALGGQKGAFALTTILGFQRVSLTGTGASLTVSPNMTDFSTVPLGEKVTKTITISNGADSALPYTLHLKSGAVYEFGFSGCPSPVAAHSSCILTATFMPDGVHTTTLDQTLNNGATVYTEFYVTGTGIVPFTLSPASHEFGGIPVGASTNTTFTLANVSTLDFNIGRINVSSGAGSGLPVAAYNPSSNCPTVLAAGASCTITVVFTPTTNAYPYPAFLSVLTPSGTLSSALNGTGVYTGADFSLKSDVTTAGVSTSAAAIFNLSMQTSVPNQAFPYPITLSYSGALPAGYTATFTPVTVAPGNGLDAVTSVFKVSSNGKALLIGPPGQQSKFPLPLACSLFGLAFLARKRLRRGALMLILCLGLMAGAAGISGCGMTNTFQGTITAKGNGMTHTVAVTLYQQP